VSISLAEAYAVCEAISRREAKNFYYAFRVLPRPKRAAICAVYAFMRHADDLADDELLPREERLQQTQRWMEDWHRAAAGSVSDNPIFVALRDTQRRFEISTTLLDQLVEGTSMDLTAPAESMVYRNFDELYRYCYFVASVVGLVCIRIFGYTDQRAEKLAEETGVAFQLTNILRDIREDAERGRVYLPIEDLDRYNVSAEQLSSIRGDRKLTLDEHALMEMEGERARKYYAAADGLLPLIAPDSRAALWVLVKIYRRLLDRIVGAHYEVFSARISVPTWEKLWILLRGFWMALRLRIARSN
jgi:phytoene synthase